MSSDSESAEPAVCALRDFNQGRYDECVARLNEVSTVVKNNKRVLFNRAVAEYHRSGCKNTKSFQRELSQITGADWPNVDVDDVSSQSDVYAYYACAVVLYRTRFYAQARRLLEKLLTFRDRASDGALVCNVALLLMEVYLCCRMPNRVVLLTEQCSSLFQNQSADAKDLFNRLKLRACLMDRRQLSPVSNVTSIDWLFLRAHQQLINGDAYGAIVTLSQHRQFQTENSDELWAPLNNNLAVLHSCIKKHNLSVKYMQQALKEHLSAVKLLKTESDPNPSICKDRPVYVFNLGISLLKANRPDDAFECLVEAVRHYSNNPKIWYHLAECCVNHHTKLNPQENVFRKIGSSAHTKLIPGHIDRDKYIISGESYAIPTLTLEFAALCLMNALVLLPDKDPPSEFFEHCVFPVNPSDPLNYKQYSELKNSVLLLYAYVSLRLNDPATALEMSAKLTGRVASPVQGALAHLYSAEALIALDKLTEALEHLSPSVIHNFTSKITSAAKDVIGFAVWLNTAVCHILRGDLMIARNILHQINSPRALPLQLYLETCAGHTENCRLLLRKFTLLKNSL